MNANKLVPVLIPLAAILTLPFLDARKEPEKKQAEVEMKSDEASDKNIRETKIGWQYDQLIFAQRMHDSAKDGVKMRREWVAKAKRNLAGAVGTGPALVAKEDYEQAKADLANAEAELEERKNKLDIEKDKLERMQAQP